MRLVLTKAEQKSLAIESAALDRWRQRELLKLKEFEDKKIGTAAERQQAMLAIEAKYQQDKLIIENRPWVKRIARNIAKKYRGFNPIPVEDLKAAGELGLVERARSFDPGCGIEFSAFAVKRVVGAIRDSIKGWEGLDQDGESNEGDEDGASKKVREWRTEWTDVESEEEDGASEDDERLSHKWHERQTYKWQAWCTLLSATWPP